MKFCNKTRILSFLLLIIFLGVSVGSVLNAEDIILETIVVTAPKNEGDEKRIESETIRTHRVVDLASILSDEMIEATMIRKGAYGNEVSIRGFGKSDLRVLIDDGILEGACGSRKDPSLSHINMLTVDRIEVREGPFDVTKAGALGESINVVTKNPQEGFHGEIISKSGSYDYWSSGFYLTGGNKIIQALMGYNYSESRQYEDGDGNKLSSFAPGGRPYTSRGRHLEAFKKDDFWGKLQLTPTENQTLLLSYSYGDAEDILAPRVGMDMESEKTRLFKADYTITDLGKFSDKLNLSFYRHKVEHNPYDKYRILVGAPSFHRRNNVESTIMGGKIENVQSTDFAELAYGIDFYHRNWDGDMIRTDTGTMFDDELIPDVDTINVGLYIKADKHFDKWSLGVGLRGDRFETKAHEPLKQSSQVTSKNRNIDAFLSGYLSVRYYLTENSLLFGGVGRSIRTPTSVERYLQSPSPDFYGNPNLDVTKNTEFDLGFQTIAQRFTLKAKAFYSNLDDYIYQEALPKTWTNIDAYLYGADIKAVVDIMDNFSIEAAVAYQRGRKDSQPKNNEDKNLAEVPPLKSKLALHYDTPKIFGTLEWIHSEDADDVDLAAGEVELSGWDVVNFRAGYQFYQYLKFHAGIDNIFDRRYAVANSYEFDVVSGTGAKPPIIYGSSGKSVGEFRFGKFAHRQK